MRSVVKLTDIKDIIIMHQEATRDFSGLLKDFSSLQWVAYPCDPKLWQR